MKRLCLLLSIIMICMLSTTAFAAGTTDATIVLTPDTTTVASDENVVITVGITGDSAEQALYGTAKIVVTWDEAFFEYVEGEVDSSTFALTNATNFAINGNKATFSQKVLNTEDRPVGAQTFGTLTLKVIGETGSSTISLDTSSTKVQVNAGTTVAGAAVLGESATVTVTVDGGNNNVKYTAISTLSQDAQDEIAAKFAGKTHFVKGDVISYTSDGNQYYIKATDGTNTVTTKTSIETFLKISESGVAVKVIPVLVTDVAEGPAITFSKVNN